MSTEPDLIKPRFMSLHHKTKILNFIFDIRYQLSGHTIIKKCNGFMLANEETDTPKLDIIFSFTVEAAGSCKKMH